MNKFISSFIFSLFFLCCQGQAVHVVDVPTGGHVISSGAGIGPGDTILLRQLTPSRFISIEYTGLTGTIGDSIYILNYPGQDLIIGDSLWTGGSWGEAIRLRNCHFFAFRKNTTGSIRIVGSKVPPSVHGNFPARGSYYPLRIEDKSSDATIGPGLVITGGANAIYAKTEVVYNDPMTWNSSGNNLGNLHIIFNDLSDAWNEMVYAGHTAERWRIDTLLPGGTPYYGSSPSDMTGPNDTTNRKIPLYWVNLDFVGNRAVGCGGDALQFSHIQNLTVIGNFVEGWAGQAQYANAYWNGPFGNASDLGGILVGGAVLHSDIHDNIVNGKSMYGEPLQLYGSGGFAPHHIYNNLFKADSGNVVSVNPRGGIAFGTKKSAVFILDHNTYYGKNTTNTMRINGAFDSLPQPVQTSNDLYIHNIAGFFYQENGGLLAEGTTTEANKKFTTVALADVDTNNFFLPNITSSITDEGYRSASVPVIPAFHQKFVLGSRVLARFTNGLLGTKKAVAVKRPVKKAAKKPAQGKKPTKKPAKKVPPKKPPIKKKPAKKGPNKPTTPIHRKFVL